MNQSSDRNFVVRTLLFENWLRFTCISEEDQHFFIRIAPARLQELAARYPEFAPLVAVLNQQEIIYEQIQQIVLDHVQTQLGERTANVLADPALETAINVLHVWIQSHEEALEELDFADWEGLFELWKVDNAVA